jgi:hypothetical protein
VFEHLRAEGVARQHVAAETGVTGEDIHRPVFGLVMLARDGGRADTTIASTRLGVTCSSCHRTASSWCLQRWTNVGLLC